MKAEYKEGPEARENFERLARCAKRFLPLLAFRGLAHDPQSVLAAVYRLALVHVEPLLNILPGRFDRHQPAGKLHVAVFTDAKQGMVTHDPKFSFCHAPSLRRPCWHSIPVEIKWHHYQISGSGLIVCCWRA